MIIKAHECCWCHEAMFMCALGCLWAWISETNSCISRRSPRLEFSESQFRDRVRDSNFLSLSFETESETEVFRVSISRPSPRLKFSESQFRDRVRDCKFQSLNFETESETQFFQVLVSRPIPRLTFSKSQYQDRVRDWNSISYSFETKSESETERTWYDFLTSGW